MGFFKSVWNVVAKPASAWGEALADVTVKDEFSMKMIGAAATILTAGAGAGAGAGLSAAGTAQVVAGTLALGTRGPLSTALGAISTGAGLYNSMGSGTWSLGDSGESVFNPAVTAPSPDEMKALFKTNPAFMTDFSGMDATQLAKTIEGSANAAAAMAGGAESLRGAAMMESVKAGMADLWKEAKAAPLTTALGVGALASAAIPLMKGADTSVADELAKQAASAEAAKKVEAKAYEEKVAYDAAVASAAKQKAAEDAAWANATIGTRAAKASTGAFKTSGGTPAALSGLITQGLAKGSDRRKSALMSFVTGR